MQQHGDMRKQNQEKKQQQTCETLEILQVKIGVKQGTWNIHTYAY